MLYSPFIGVTHFYSW